MAKAKARSAPKLLQNAARYWWQKRWSSMLATACQVALAESLVAEVMHAPCVDGGTPSLSQIAE